MENCVLKQITTQDNTSLRLYITVSEDSVQVLAFQNVDAWKSKVIKKTTLKHFATEHKFKVEDYCLQLLEYVKSNNTDVVYIFKNGELIINRSLKKLMIKYFTCKLEKVNYTQHVEQILDTLYLANTDLSKQLCIFKKENEELSHCKNECEMKLKELIARKETEEDEQLGHFMLILNEKKRHIQHLTELIDAFKRGRPTVNPQVQVINRKRKRNIQDKTEPIQKRETISDSESSSHSNDGYSSGDQTSKDDSTDIKKINLKEVTASTSTVNFDFLEDDIEESHILQKRAKPLKVGKNDVIVAPHTQSPPKEEETETVNRAKSPDIDLSTQQLLDML